MEEIWDSLTLNNENDTSGHIVSNDKGDALQDKLEGNTSIIQSKEMYERKDWLNEYKYNPNILILSQSLMKQLANKWESLDPCPRRVFHEYIKKDYRNKPTQSMENGNYFESLCLGSSRSGAKTLDLPRGKKGQKLADQIKIEHQVSRFDQYIREKGWDITPGYNTQIRLYKKYRGNVILSSELDIFPIIENDSLWLVDLKLTANVQSSFGPYQWSKPENMDHLQLELYSNMVVDIDYDLNDLYNPNNHLRELIKDYKSILDKHICRAKYLVFGYRVANEPERLHEQMIDNIEVVLNDHKQQILKERIEDAILQLKIMKNNDWQPKANNIECRNCPVNSLNGGYCEENSDTMKY